MPQYLSTAHVVWLVGWTSGHGLGGGLGRFVGDQSVQSDYVSMWLLINNHLLRMDDTSEEWPDVI